MRRLREVPRKCGVVALAVGALSVTAVPTSLAQPAGTAEPLCGQAARAADGASPKVARAELALDGQSDELVTDATFKRGTGTRMMTLIYNVTGCEMPAKAPAPQQPLRIYPAKTGDQIPAGVITLDGSPDVEGSRYIVHLKASSDAFDPGSYNGFVEIKAPWLKTVRTPVTVSRSENRVLVPLGLGGLGAVAGFALFGLLRWYRKNDLLVSRAKLVLAGVVSVVAGAFAAYATNYLSQDVWSSAENARAALGVGFTASTSGVMTALLAAVWSADAPGAARGGPAGGPASNPTPPQPQPR